MKTKDLKPLHLPSQDVLDSLGVVLTGKEKALKKLKMVKVLRKIMNKKFPIWRYQYKQYTVDSEVITIEVDNKRFKIFSLFFGQTGSYEIHETYNPPKKEGRYSTISSMVHCEHIKPIEVIKRKVKKV